ncbi:MAG: aspartate kinase [Bacteroidota bacterium]
MRIFKFGGASVKDAESVRNIPGILSKYKGDDLVVIVSAMGKTTNALEALAGSAFNKDASKEKLFADIKAYHQGIAEALFPDKAHDLYKHFDMLFRELEGWIHTDNTYDYDMYYDQIVPYGELLSTRIISYYLNESGLKEKWMDVRELIITDSTYRSAKVDWDATSKRITERVKPEIMMGNMVISQGFIAGNGHYSTSLGREGSDFTSAIFAHILDAEEVIVWKDVPGYLNADPKFFDDTVKLDRISYTESIELAFYGAKIIHPKTIRPLKNKRIPLLVKSFLEPDAPGSLIYEDISSDALVPSFIVKENQVLISISSRDFSFIAEDHLHKIFGLFSTHRVRINLMQNSAISFSVCTDNTARLKVLIEELQKGFRLKYNDELQLVTIRHYDEETIDRLSGGKEILLEQRSRVTVQMVIK